MAELLQKYVTSRTHMHTRIVLKNDKFRARPFENRIFFAFELFFRRGLRLNDTIIKAIITITSTVTMITNFENSHIANSCKNTHTQLIKY